MKLYKGERKSLSWQIELELQPLSTLKMQFFMATAIFLLGSALANNQEGFQGKILMKSKYHELMVF